ncbi:MAG: hypothetical protein KKF68_01215 [Nanoarchaeota archaeon]|nr:hypothetical protein [Nanoarchaeota archaeon]
MLTKKEIIPIIIVTIILSFAMSMIKSVEIFLYAFVSILLVILINTLAKKVASFYLESEIEVRLWEIKRTGLSHFLNILPLYSTHPSTELKRPFPAGAFFPILSKIILFPINNFVWMASLVFEVKPKIYRAAKRHGLYSFSEMTEYHIGLIAVAGIIANLCFAIVGYLLNFPEFAKISVYYSFFNLIPLSDLDGNKIFFGSIITWSFLASLVLIGLFFAMFLV